jgi:hypothetical protein
MHADNRTARLDAAHAASERGKGMLHIAHETCLASPLYLEIGVGV